jgi:hypothetical protein
MTVKIGAVDRPCHIDKADVLVHAVQGETDSPQEWFEESPTEAVAVI